MPTPELCRKLGVSAGTFYRWKSKYGGMELGDAKRLKALEDENRRLKKLVADQALDIQVLNEPNHNQPRLPEYESAKYSVRYASN